MDGIFQRASACDVSHIYSLIRTRIAWMDDQGIESWNKTDYLDRFPEAYFLKKYHTGELYVLRGSDGELHVAVVLLTEDKRWDGLPPAHAYYLHNLVSAPDAHGAGRTILHCVETLAHQNGKEVLRLDCIRGSKAINRFYERAGYLACGECKDGPYHGILREKRLAATPQ
jgi:hypothetical protein